MALIKKILLTLLLVFLVASSVVMTTPLQFIMEHTGAPSLPVRIEHLQGTIIEGRSQVSLPLEFTKQTLEVALMWDWCPSVWAPLTWCVAADSEPIRGTATVAGGLSNTITLRQLSAVLDLDKQPLIIGNQQISIDGRVEVLRAHLDLPLDSYFPQNLEGEVVVKNLATRLFKLGDFRIALISESDTSVAATLQGGGDLLTLKGGRASLSNDGRYQYNLEVESSHTMFRNLLRVVGKANAKGGYRLAKTGTLR